MERTLVLIKPDAFRKHYTGDIIKRYESEGFHILAMKTLTLKCQPVAVSLTAIPA